MKSLFVSLAAAAVLTGCVAREAGLEEQPLARQAPPTAAAEEAETAQTAPARSSGGGLERGDPTYQPVSAAERRGWDPRFRKGCEIIIRTVWTETRRGRYIIEAESKTESCEDVELSIAIRAPDQRVVYRANLDAEDVYGFADVTRPTEMRGALIDWATNYGSLTRRSGRLPYWPRGAARPNVGVEYPFIVDESWSRVAYIEARKADEPVFCHVSTFDSMTCVLLVDAEQTVRPLGVQKFPPRDGSG